MTIAIILGVVVAGVVGGTLFLAYIIGGCSRTRDRLDAMAARESLADEVQARYNRWNNP